MEEEPGEEAEEVGGSPEAVVIPKKRVLTAADVGAAPAGSGKADAVQGLLASSLGSGLGPREKGAGASEVVTAPVDAFLLSVADKGSGCCGWRGCKAACFALMRNTPAGLWWGHCCGQWAQDGHG